MSWVIVVVSGLIFGQMKGIDCRNSGPYFMAKGLQKMKLQQLVDHVSHPPVFEAFG